MEEAEAEGEPVTVSHASIISRAFGPRLAFLGGCAFCAQMVAVITAQVVKGGEFLALATGAPYRVACILPTVLVGLFTFLCKPGVVERANTALATAMLFGFAALVAGAIAFGAGGGRSGPGWQQPVQQRVQPRAQLAPEQPPPVPAAGSHGSRAGSGPSSSRSAPAPTRGQSRSSSTSASRSRFLS